MINDIEKIDNVYFLGALISLIRRLVRPFITIAMTWWNWLYFTEEWFPGQISTLWTSEKVHMLLIINIIVLIFWFGERALKNSGVLNLVEKIVNNFVGIK